MFAHWIPVCTRIAGSARSGNRARAAKAKFQRNRRSDLPSSGFTEIGNRDAERNRRAEFLGERFAPAIRALAGGTRSAAGGSASGCHSRTIGFVSAAKNDR